MAPGDQSELDPLIGALIDGKYRVVRLIGRGGMGAVYEGRHETINRRVAVKVMLPHVAHDPQVRQRFLNEARIGGELGQENIVEVTDLGLMPSGAPYLVMEYLEGRNLSQLLKAKGPLPTEAAVEIVGHVLEALIAVHQAKVVHRDLKPGNVFLAQYTTPAGRQKMVVKVLDFGISKLKSPDDPELTREGVQMGSPAFMSPEQARDTKRADHLSDIYSAGALLYSALTAQAPFQGTSSEILASVIRDDPLPPRHHRPDLDRELEQVVLKAMAREPRERFQTAREFLAALEPFLSGQSTLVDGFQQPTMDVPTQPLSATLNLSSLSSMVVPQTREVAPARWPRVVAIVLALLLVIGVTSIVSILASRSSSSEPSPQASATPPTGAEVPATEPLEPPVPEPEPTIEAAVEGGEVVNEPEPPAELDVPADQAGQGPVKQAPVPTESAGISQVRPTKAAGSATKAPSGASPSSEEAEVRQEAQRRLAAVRGAVSTCVGGRASRVSCILVLDGSGGASVSVTADPPSTVIPGCVRAVVRGLRFPTFEGEPVRMNYTYRFEDQDE